MTIKNLDLQVDINRQTIVLDATLQTVDEQRLGQQLVAQAEHTKTLLDELVARFDTNAENVRRFSNEDGLLRGMGELRTQTRHELDAITGKLNDELSKRCESLRARLVTPPANQSDATAIQIERRQILRGLDPLLILPIYNESCKVRDSLTWQAIENAAPFDPLRRTITAADIEAGRRVRTEIEYPDCISALKETERVIDALASSVRSIETHCQVRPDVIARLAGDENAFY